MDEPFGALDAVTRASITNEFSNLEVLKNKTIVLVTHDIREAFQLGNKILLMDKGKIVQEGTPADLLFKPAGNFVTKFFEDQRMQLELNAVLLSHIWPFLDAKSNHQNNTDFIGDDKSVWDALNILSGKKRGSINVKESVTGEIKTAGYDSLFTALGAFKRSMHE